MKKNVTRGRLLLLSFLSLFLLTFQVTYAQKEEKPRWVDYSTRNALYPTSTYVSGFASEPLNSSETEQDIQDRLKNYARVQLVEGIQVSIKSMTATATTIEDAKTSSFFKQTSVSLSKVNISGLTSELYTDEKDKNVYAFCYAKKADISKLYRTNIANAKLGIEKNIKEAEAALTTKDNQTALKNYYECYPLFRDAEEAQTLIIAFENIGAESPDLHVAALSDLKSKVNAGIKNLSTSKNNTLDDVVMNIAYGIKLQASKIEKTIRIVNFTFQESKMASSFSKRLTSSLEQKLVAQSFACTTQPIVATSGNVVTDDSYMFSGTYWEEGENIKIIAIMREPVTGKAVASAEGLLPKAWLTAQSIDYKPSNYNEAVNNLVAFNSDIVANNGGLVVEVTTNKGNDNPVFADKDTLNIFLRANKECYVRLIYTFADGSKVLFLDNYYIPSNMVNKIIELPSKFECCEPFGVEVLQLVAQSKEFAPLNVKEENSIKFIQDDLKKMVASTRAFKPITNKDLKAEKIVTITTVQK
jgi:hypothetical protein